MTTATATEHAGLPAVHQGPTPEQVWDAITTARASRRSTSTPLFGRGWRTADAARTAPTGELWATRRSARERPRQRRLVHEVAGASTTPILAAEEAEPRHLGDRAAGRWRYEADARPRPAQEYPRQRSRWRGRLECHPQRTQDAAQRPANRARLRTSQRSGRHARCCTLTGREGVATKRLLCEGGWIPSYPALPRVRAKGRRGVRDGASTIPL